MASSVANRCAASAAGRSPGRGRVRSSRATAAGPPESGAPRLPTFSARTAITVPSSGGKALKTLDPNGPCTAPSGRPIASGCCLYPYPCVLPRSNVRTQVAVQSCSGGDTANVGPDRRDGALTPRRRNVDAPATNEGHAPLRWSGAPPRRRRRKARSRGGTHDEVDGAETPSSNRSSGRGSRALGLPGCGSGSCERRGDVCAVTGATPNQTLDGDDRSGRRDVDHRGRTRPKSRSPVALAAVPRRPMCPRSS